MKASTEFELGYSMAKHDILILLTAWNNIFRIEIAGDKFKLINIRLKLEEEIKKLKTRRDRK